MKLIKPMMLVSLMASHTVFADTYEVLFGLPAGGNAGIISITNNDSYKSMSFDMGAVQYNNGTYDLLDTAGLTAYSGMTGSTVDANNSLMNITDIIGDEIHISKMQGAISTTTGERKYGRKMVYNGSTGAVVTDKLIAYSQDDKEYAESKGYTVILAEGTSMRDGGTNYSFKSYSTNSLTSGAVTSKGGLNSDQMTDSEGNSIVRKESDGTTHIGKNSVVFSDSTITTHGNDQIHSSVGKLQLGNSSSHRTIIKGTLEVPEPTAGNHATSKDYVDKIHYKGMSMLAASSAIVYGEKGFGMGIGGNIQNHWGLAAGYLDRDNNVSLNISSDMEDQAQLSVGWGW
jgi:hypothetical protein